MRESSSWRDTLVKDLRTAGLDETTIPATALVQVELGLHFLARFFPGEPIGVLQSILSGYIGTSPELQPVIRRVRHRMGDVARRGWWRNMLNQYVRITSSMRVFERQDDPGRRVSDRTMFAARESSICPERIGVYDSALEDALEYAAVRQCPPAQADKRYSFTVNGRTEFVQLPAGLPMPTAVPMLEPATSRARESWTVSFEKHLAPTAAWIDEQLANRPDIRNRNFTKRLADMRFNTVDRNGDGLIDRPDEFVIDGVEHIVGLMNSGKTTFADLLTIQRVRDHGNRVCLVVSSVGDVYGRVSFLRALGINAVPLIGRSSKGEHAGRFWRTMIEEAETLFPDGTVPPDPAAEYANTSCLLEVHRSAGQRDWAPLAPEDFPCRGQLRETDGVSQRAHDCPLLSVCPAQKALREIAAAQVWVTTPQCLAATRAEATPASMRWFELVQHHVDLMVIDEADAVQQVFDQRFVQTEELVAPNKGWTHRMNRHTNDAMSDASMAPSPDPEVLRWHEFLDIHQQAVLRLNALALSQAGEPLKIMLGDATFTAHSLLRSVTRTLFGLPRSGEGEKETEDAAEDFYQQQLQDFAEQPLLAVGHGLDDTVGQMIRPIRDEDAVRSAIDAWVSNNTRIGDLETQDQTLLRLTIEAAVWAGRITTTFFEMATMYPSIKDRLNLPDEETFWLDQPPRDYRALVPEAPMGNILALRWAANRAGGAALQLLWVHGIGRWLLHHAHDLLSAEGIHGPHVILTSATSWIPGSSYYHIPIEPSAVLRQPDADQAALLTSTMSIRTARTPDDQPIFVSGRSGGSRDDALRQMVSFLCLPGNGRHRSVIDELRAELPTGRQQILGVVLSGREAQTVTDHINNKTPYHARNVVPDAADPGRDGIQRRRIAAFGTSSSDLLVAAEMSIQRGYNILNANDTAALGAVIYLTRSHPPPFDLAFPLSLISQLAMRQLSDPITPPLGEVAAAARDLRTAARRVWFGQIGRPVVFRNVDAQYRSAFVANSLVPMSQTIGRSIRGNQPTRVLLCDAAYAERHAHRDTARDTERTSLIVAIDVLLSGMLTVPGPDSTPRDRRLHAINDAVWGLLGHLVRTNDPLGSQRDPAHGRH